MKNPRVSVLILHKNGEEIIKNCLDSLKKTDYPNFETVVLLNGTEDDSEGIIKKYKVKIYKSKKNLGFAGGNNFLIERTKSKYVVLMNNDVEVDKNWLKELVNFSEKNNADVCQPKILSLKEKQMFDYAGAAGGFIDKYGYPFCRGRIFDKIERDNRQYNCNRRIFWACGSCMMIKREILEKSGLFDEDFFMYAEEVDLCWRINLVGGRIFNVYKSRVYHLGGYSIQKERLESKKEFLVHRNSLLMFFKNYSRWSIIKLLIPRMALEITSGIVFPKKIPPILKSFLWLFLNSRKIARKQKDVQKLREVDDKSMPIFQGSIALSFFILKKRRFEELNGVKKCR